jgi:RNA polymerase sigma-70 factor (ECF subfamily)
MTDPAPAPSPLEAVFTAERPRLVGLAYRVMGSRLDAEDVVQEAWLRAQRVDWTTIERPEAWFTTVVSRLALDDLRLARRSRETYVGPWLPEPVRTSSDDEPGEVVALAESLTFGFLRLLETLGPAERVVFLLADVFDTPYDEIAAVVDRSPEACRQLASRARRRVRAGDVRHDLPDDATQVVGELLAAVVAGEVDRVVALLADDVVVVSDGGAGVRAARRPVTGPLRSARLMINIAHRALATMTYEPMVLNGEPGLLIRTGDGRPFMSLSVQVTAGKVEAIHVVRNPRKLTGLDLPDPLL